MPTACQCNCFPCWHCGKHPTSIALQSLRGYGYGDGCCSAIAGSYTIAPWGSTIEAGRVLIPETREIIHDTFGIERTYGYIAAKNACNAGWHFEPQTEKEYTEGWGAPFTAKTIGPICGEHEFFAPPGWQWWGITAAQIVLRLSNAKELHQADRPFVEVKVSLTLQGPEQAVYRTDTYRLDATLPCNDITDAPAPYISREMGASLHYPPDPIYTEPEEIGGESGEIDWWECLRDPAPLFTVGVGFD
ncbi:hypothetical protein Q31a_27120 [Aureliella helgolandensis]|uniref:Uncharacterized protein n=1 Tax=Aureliella helgolandensis TaxID=2527968 RepID=A0A518G734_9BACT|nr:hypothetical protein Q31a_27120 [Aureliella helgolandensis]